MQKAPYLAESKEYYSLITSTDERPDLADQAIQARSSLYTQSLDADLDRSFVDNDGFDDHYQHVLVLKKDTHEVIAGYRFVKASSIIKTLGFSGLYTYKLYDFDQAYFDYLGPSLELGRMFIAESHRDGMAFLLLWRSLLKFILKHPDIRYFYGSINLPSTMEQTQLQRLLTFWQQKQRDPEISARVQPRYPLSETLFAKSNELIIPNTLPGLANNYQKLGGKFSAYTQNPYLFQAYDVLVTVLIKTIPQDMIRFIMRGDPEASLIPRS